MSSRRYTLIAGLLAAAIHQTGVAQNDALQLLVEQGKYWQERGDDRRALEAWEKLLRASPRHPDALYGMAMLELQAKRPAGAQKYLGELRSTAPNSPLVAQLEQQIRLAGGGAQRDLSDARRLSQSGESEKAIAKYQQALDGKEPSGELGLEYYQTLGATESGWEQARRGLERLAKSSPSDARIGLALAQVLTYREATRPDGIQRLGALAGHPQVGTAASQSWRQALLWLGDPPAHRHVPLFETYLKANPQDIEVSQRLARVGPDPATAKAEVDPLERRNTAGFKALDDGRLTAAEAEFNAVLAQSPKNANALGGLGVLRLRQQQFGAARDLLQQASRQGGGARWRQPLNNATYWALVRDAEKARAASGFAEARKLLVQAVNIDSKEPVGQLALADVLAASGDTVQAEKIYRHVLAGNRNDQQALAGLVGVLAQNGKAEEALGLVARLTPEQQRSIGGLGRVRAEQAMAQAKAASQRGDDAAAATALQDALVNDPNNPWIRLDIARIYLKSGAVRDARGVVDGLLVSHPELPDALYASALLSAEMQDWSGTLATLERIAPEARTADMGELQRRAWVHAQADWAGTLARQGRQAEAINVLAQAQGQVKDDLDLLGAIASGYAEAGDSVRALGMIRQLMSRTTQTDFGLQLQYAAILAKTGQDIELAGVLRQLHAAPLTAAQRENYHDLRYGYVIRQADALREQGQLADAYEVLAPLLAERPGDAMAAGALARLYADAGEPGQALDLYKQVLAQNPDDLPTLLGAASTATQAGQYKVAESAVETALVHDPRNPEVLAAAARLYRAQGKNSKAIEYLKLAVATTEPERRPDGGAARNPGGGGNPFSNRRGGAGNAALAYGNATPGQPYVPPPATAAGYGQPGTQGTSATGSYTAPLVSYAQAGNASLPPAAIPDYLPAPVVPGQPRNAPAYQAPASTGLWNLPTGSRSASEALPWQTPQAERPRTLRDELAELQQERSPDITVGTTVRSRDGESGMSGFTDVQAPLEARLPVGDGKLSLRVAPVSLSSDTMRTDFNTTSRFGGGPEAALQAVGGAGRGPGPQDATGMGVAVAYKGENVEADIGTTPLGFQEAGVVGGLHLKGRHSDSGMNYGVNLSRRAVTDSILSFAGTRDARTGQRWGGVTATGARLDLGFDGTGYGVYGYGSWHTLQGHNVVTNSRIEGGFGAYANLWRTSDSELTTGLNVTGISYDKNLRYFTYGHGGYFSPQRFFSVSVPLQWSQRSGRFSYQVRGSLGVQNFREDDAPYFPSSRSLQARAQSAMASALADELTTNGSAVYPGQSKTGLGYSLSAALEYQMAPQLFLGGSLATDNASDYDQWAAGVYLRYMFTPSTRPMQMPLSPYGSPYGQ